jgi:hypothetical protein
MRNDRPWSAGVNRRGLFCALCLTARRILAAALLAASIVCAGISHRRSAREWFDSGLAKKGQTQQQKNDCEDTLHGTDLLPFTSLFNDLQAVQMFPPHSRRHRVALQKIQEFGFDREKSTRQCLF